MKVRMMSIAIATLEAVSKGVEKTGGTKIKRRIEITALIELARILTKVQET